MASISPISTVSAFSASPLILPPSGNSGSLTLPATSTTQPTASTSTDATSGATTASTQAQSAAQSSTSTAATATPATAATPQPLGLVFGALATAGLEASIDQTILTPPTAQSAGAFSIFMDQLFAAIAAQQTAIAQAKAAQANASGGAQASGAQPTTATAAFASNAAAATPNSALEGSVQALANQVQLNADANATQSNAVGTGSALAPLQQSFDQLIATSGGTTSTAGLPTFLQAFANNLHAVPTPLGNLVNAQT
jgi:hypothetical protein